MNMSTKPTSLWLDEETRQLLEGLAADAGTSRSQVIREAIRKMADDKHEAEVRRLVAALAREVLG